MWCSAVQYSLGNRQKRVWNETYLRTPYNGVRKLVLLQLLHPTNSNFAPSPASIIAVQLSLSESLTFPKRHSQHWQQPAHKVLVRHPLMITSLHSTKRDPRFAFSS